MADTNPYDKVTITNISFWDLWIQKIFRNLASVKYQWLLFLYIPVIYGMFHMTPAVGSAASEPWISATLGLSFLGGGFITLATSRMITRTKLTEDNNKKNNGNHLDTDR